MKFLKVVFLAIILINFGVQTTLACRCFTVPPPCYAYSQYDAVFVGIVKEVKFVNDSFPPMKTTIAVEKSYKGINSEMVFTETGSTSCDFEGYDKNKKLLIYGNLCKAKTFFTTSYCSRSTTFKENLVDFDFLEALNSSTTNYWIWGTISRSGDAGNPIQGIKAEIKDGKKTLTGISNQDGDLKIVVSKEGKYRVRVYFPKGAEVGISQWGEEQWRLMKRGGTNKRGRYVEYEVEVKNNRCGWFDSVIHGIKK